MGAEVEGTAGEAGAAEGVEAANDGTNGLALGLKEAALGLSLLLLSLREEEEIEEEVEDEEADVDEEAAASASVVVDEEEEATSSLVAETAEEEEGATEVADEEDEEEEEEEVEAVSLELSSGLVASPPFSLLLGRRLPTSSEKRFNSEISFSRRAGSLLAELGEAPSRVADMCLTLIGCLRARAA